LGLFTALGWLPLASCQSYERRPLDSESTRTAIAERTPDSARVADFARRLAEADTAAVPADFNPADGLTLAEAEVVALVFNPELRLARLQAGVARASADTAGIWEDPVTGFNLNDVLQQAGGGFSMGAQISLTIPISGRLAAEKERAGAAFAAQLAHVEAAEWNTRIGLRRAWTAWTSTAERIRVVRETAQSVTRVTDIAARMEAANEMPRVEARLFEIERATQIAEGERLEAQLAEEAVTLRRIMGLAPWSNLQLTPVPLHAEDPPPVEQMRDQLVTRSPLIAAIRAEYEVSERALATEIRKQYPDLQIGPSYNTDGNEDFALGVQFPLPLWNHNQQGVAEATAERELSRARFETAVEIQLAELESKSVRYQSAVKQRRVVEDQIVPLVDLQATETHNIATLGEVNTLLLLDSLTRQQNAKLALLDARRTEVLSHIELIQLIGPPAKQPSPVAQQAAPKEPLP
jgi:outer membrane protein TolC